MSLKKYFLGGRGPFFFNDSLEYGEDDLTPLVSTEDITEEDAFPTSDLDENGNPVLQGGFRSTGPIRSELAPSLNNEVIRMTDLMDGLGNVTIAAGFRLIFKGEGATPDASIYYTGGMLVIMIDSIVVGRFRITS